MKMLTNVKIHMISYFKNLSRERIAIFICIPLALVALSVCAIMLLNSQDEAPKAPSDVVYATEAQTEKYTYPPNSPYALEFESFNNGSCVIVGVGDFDGKDLQIPQRSPNGDVVVEIKSEAFKNCKTLESVTIPSTVERIGVGAFRGCDSLAYIDVDMKNKSFTSLGGVLFSKSRTRLIFYPPNSSETKYYINPNVKTIDDYAFDGAKNITAILYPNSTAEFELIAIGKGNDVLHTLPITCNYSGDISGK